MSARIYNDDCLLVMRQMPPSSIQAVITDPPYCSGAFSEVGKKSAAVQGIRSERALEEGFEWFPNDNMSTAGLIWLLRSMMVEAERLLVDGGHALVFTDWRMVPHLAPALESSGLQYRNMIVWDKGSTALGNGFRPAHEIILHYVKGSPVFHALNGSNVIRCPRVPSGERQHETQKPTKLLAELIRVATKEGDTILDPFCGSGSTGDAALRLGRNFIGIDKSTVHSRTADNRLIDVASAIQGQMFPAGETFEP